MSATGHGPCLAGWEYSAFCCDAIPAEDDRTPEQQALFDKLHAVAAEVLWRASGRRYGTTGCPIKARPCRPSCSPSTYGNSGLAAFPWLPLQSGGSWINIRCGDNCTGKECCSAGCKEIVLPGPVHAVTEVAVDGVVLPADSYRVDDHRRLVRMDGACWPACQDMALADGEAGTWSVTYELGIPLGAEGQYAFSVYLCELWKLCTGARCRLPLNVEGVFRQGVNIDFADANLDLLSGMRTGIPEVDGWLAGVNPDRLRSPSSVWSVDAPRPRVTTWSAP